MSHKILSTDKIVAVTRIQPPFTYDCVMDPELVETCNWAGINFDIFRTLMSVIGLDYSIIRAEDDTTAYQTTNGTWRGMLAQLERGEANMTATLIGVNEKRLAIADFSAPVAYYINGFIVKAPTSVNVMDVPLKFLFAPYNLTGWILLLMSTLVIATLLVICARVYSGITSWSRISDTTYDVIRLVLMQPHFFNDRVPPRILFVGFEIAMFFIVSFYTSYLTSSLLVSLRPSNPFTGFDEFAQLVFDKKYTLITDDRPEKHVPITNMKFSEKPDEKMRIAYQWNPPVFVEANDFDAIVRKIIENGTLAYYGSYYHLLYGSRKSCDVKVVVDTYTHPTWLAFAFPKGSRLQNLISTALHRDYTSVDSYLNRLYDRYSQKRTCSYLQSFNPSFYTSFGLYEMQGAFTVLIVGAASSICVACLEFLKNKVSNRRQFFKSIKIPILHNGARDTAKGPVLSNKIIGTSPENILEEVKVGSTAH